MLKNHEKGHTEELNRRENEFTTVNEGEDDEDEDEDEEEDDFITETHVSCDFSEFACKDGKECIRDSLRCDGHIHCLDQSDEEGCPGFGEGEPIGLFKTYLSLFR